MGRNLGLDILRSAAIIGVIGLHLFWDLPGHELGMVFPVELFFAISGYLIAQMIVERFDGISSMRAFWAFALNRWMRIWPLYWLTLFLHVVILVLIWPNATGITGLIFRHLLFIQDLTAGSLDYNGSFFPNSWSLAIEEWFYLLCPLVLLVGGALARSRCFWYALGPGLILLAVGARAVRYMSDSGLSQVYFYRMPTLLHPDVFLYGAAVYFLMDRVFAHRPARSLAAVIGLSIVVLDFLLTRDAPEGLFVKVVLPSLAPLSMALLIPAMVHFQSSLDNLIRPVVHWLSTRTYALYLIHGPLVVICIPGERGLMPVLLFLSVSGLMANALHLYVERPIMARRPMRAPSLAIATAVTPAPPVSV